ncbi:MAG: LruC domain-containing protein [Calditrichia bacterium]
MDEALFGTEDDASQAQNGRYYRTQNNLTWALNIPDVWGLSLRACMFGMHITTFSDGFKAVGPVIKTGLTIPEMKV